MEQCLAFLKEQDQLFSMPSNSQPEIPPEQGRCFVLGKDYYALVYRSHQLTACLGDPPDVREVSSSRVDKLMLVRSNQKNMTWRREPVKKTEDSTKGNAAAETKPTAMQFGNWEFSHIRPCSHEDPERDEYLHGVFDLDHDGRPELLILEHEELHDCAAHRNDDIELKLLTLEASGETLPYAHTPPGIRPINDHEPGKDVNGDGMLELFSRGPYEKVDQGGCENGDPSPAIPPVFAHHLLLNGDFSADDAVAKKAIQSWCKEPIGWTELEKKALAKGIEWRGEDGLAKVAVCARVWGMGKQDAEAALDKVCRAHWQNTINSGLAGANADCEPFYDAKTKSCQAWLKELVTIEPPVKLP